MVSAAAAAAVAAHFSACWGSAATEQRHQDSELCMECEDVAPRWSGEEVEAAAAALRRRAATEALGLCLAAIDLAATIRPRDAASPRWPHWCPVRLGHVSSSR